MRRLVLPALVLLIAAPAAGQISIPNATVTGGEGGVLELGLGDVRRSSLIVSNPEPEEDIYVLEASTSFSTGSLGVVMIGDDRTGDRVRVEVPPESDIAVPVEYTASACTAGNCLGSVSFVGRSLEQNIRFTTSADVNIQRDTDVYGSPGLTLVNLVLLGVLGAVAAGLRRDAGRA